MKNYESPTIELAGGDGIEVQPQAIFIIPDIFVAVATVYAWVFYKFTGIPEPPINYNMA